MNESRERVNSLLSETPQKRLYDVQIRFLMERIDVISENVVATKSSVENWKRDLDARCERHSKEITDTQIALQNKASIADLHEIDKRSFKSSVFISLLATLPSLITMVGGFLAIVYYLKTTGWGDI